METRPGRIGPWLGGAILLGLVALMLVVAAIRGTVVAGQPVAAPVPGPPEPGDCLLEDPFAGDVDGYVLLDGVMLPAWRTGRCDGVRFGEVVSIGAGVDLDASFQDGSWDRCWDDAAGYLGLPGRQAGAGHRSPEANVMAALIGPDPRQQAAGQDWAACVVQPAPTGSGSTVEHSLRDAWSRADDRRLFALCLTDTRSLQAVDCRERHGAEQISSWSGDPAGSGAPDVDACRQEAIGALGSPRPLDRGELTTVALPTRWSDASGRQITGPDAVSATQPYVVICLLLPADPARALVGPLRALGDAPVPLG